MPLAPVRPAALPSLEQVRAEQARRSLSRFIRYGWPVLEPTTPMEWNWHIDVVADHLQAAFEDWQAKRDDRTFTQRIQNLVVNIPPGTAKSRIVCVMWPAWVWTRHPSFRWIFLSSNPRVALRDSVYCRDVIESKWYQDWFRPEWQLRDDDNAKSKYGNTAGGFRAAFGFSSRITGDRADAIVWDDPHDADEVHSDALRVEVLERWDNAIGNRVNDLRSSLRVGIMQRLHEGDLSGHVLGKGGWEHLVLPMEREPEPPCKCESCQRGQTAIGWSDTRAVGEVLHESRFPPEVLAAEKVRLGSTGYAGQMNQRPGAAAGNILMRHWWRYWQPKGMNLGAVPVRDENGDLKLIEPVEFDVEAAGLEFLQSWDMAFKDTKASAFVVGQAWARRSADAFLIDQVRDKMDFVKTCKVLKDFSARHPKALLKLVEEKANGAAVINSLKSEIGGMVPVEPEGSKEARAHAAAPSVEAGNCYVPHPALFGWVDDFLGECTGFPNTTYKDQVDAFTQMAARWLIKPKKKWGF
jgi:predicted phage terminase large subunit-like protein